MSDELEAERGAEADWRTNLHVPPPEWKTSDRIMWLRRHRIEQGDRCHYCGCRFLSVEEDRLLVPTLDHVMPKCAGGEHSFENTVAACWLCNTAKSGLTPEEARELLPHRRAALVNLMELRERKQRARKKREAPKALVRAEELGQGGA